MQIMLQRHNYVTLLSWRKNAILEEIPAVYENYSFAEHNTICQKHPNSKKKKKKCKRRKKCSQEILWKAWNIASYKRKAVKLEIK